MKIRVTLKDPDGFYDCVADAVSDSVPAKMDADERAAVVETRLDKVWKKLGKWVEYKEYLTVEFDTEKMTATVLECQ